MIGECRTIASHVFWYILEPIISDQNKEPFMQMKSEMQRYEGAGEIVAFLFVVCIPQLLNLSMIFERFHAIEYVEKG